MGVDTLHAWGYIQRKMLSKLPQAVHCTTGTRAACHGFQNATSPAFPPAALFVLCVAWQASSSSGWSQPCGTWIELTNKSSHSPAPSAMAVPQHQEQVRGPVQAVQTGSHQTYTSGLHGSLPAPCMCMGSGALPAQLHVQLVIHHGPRHK